jgi:hypothetical protein
MKLRRAIVPINVGSYGELKVPIDVGSYGELKVPIDVGDLYCR